MSEELVVTPREDVVVVASNAEQMAVAQKILVERAEDRLTKLRTEVGDLKQNLERAQKYKLRQTGILNAIYKANRRVTFYEKLRDAFKAGYTLIPDMDINVFAIKTTRKKPHGAASQEHADFMPSVALPDQESDRSGSGEGRYVAPEATEDHRRWPRNDAKGRHVNTHSVYADAFIEEIGFPFALAKPEIVEMTGRAMALKIFDEIGVLPNRRRTADPMVVGRVVLREGWQRRNMSFLICWFVDTKTI